MVLPPLSSRWLVLAVAAAALAALVCIGTPKASTAGDFAGPLGNARDLLAGRDPLAIPPADDRHIPYPLTAATFALPLTLLPPLVISALVTAMLVAAIGMLSAGQTSGPAGQPLLLLAYVPLIFNLQLIQWAPLLLLTIGLHRWLVHLDERGSRWAWIAAGLVCVTLIVKAQLLPILALPVVALLLLERRWRVLAAVVAGWGALFGLSLLLRPNWPLVWWEQTRLFARVYPAPALTIWWLGIPLVGLALAVTAYAWREGDHAALLGALVVGASLLTPQRAIYEAAALVPALVVLLRRPRLALVAVAVSWAIPFQPQLGVSPDLLLLLVLFLPPLVGLALAVRTRAG